MDLQHLSLPGQIGQFTDVAAVNTLGRLVTLGTACVASPGLDEDRGGGSVRLDVLERPVRWIQRENRQWQRTISAAAQRLLYVGMGV